MSILYQKPAAGRDGYWYVRTVWPDGKRTRAPRAETKKALDQVNKKIELAIIDEDRIWKKLRKELRLEERESSLGFTAFADNYYNSYVVDHNRGKDKKKHRISIISRYFKDIPLDKIDVRAIDGFVSSRKKEGVKNQTINHDMAVLRHMLAWAIKRGYLEGDNQCDRWESLEEVEYVGERPYDYVIDRILESMDPSIAPLYWFMRETGCRRNEAISLRPSQLFIPDDRSKAVVTFHTNTKNAKSRQVPLTEKAVWAIKQMPRYGNYIFYRPDTMSKWTDDGVKWFWKKAKKNVLIKDDNGTERQTKLRIHDLRHAFAIKLAERGVAMHFISAVLGHASTEFTRKTYAKFSPQSASRAVLEGLEKATNWPPEGKPVRSQKPVSRLESMVGGTGFEPVTLGV